MARTRNQQEFDNAADNKNPMPQSGDEIVVHSKSLAINQVAKGGQHIEADLPQNLIEEITPNSHMFVALKRLF